MHVKQFLAEGLSRALGARVIKKEVPIPLQGRTYSPPVKTGGGKCAPLRKNLILYKTVTMAMNYITV